MGSRVSMAGDLQARARRTWEQLVWTPQVSPSPGVRVHQRGETLGIAEGPRAAGFQDRKEYFGHCLINSLVG